MGKQCWFLFQGEPFIDTRTRLQERLGVADKDFAKYKFSLVTSTVFKQPTGMEDSEFSSSSLSKLYGVGDKSWFDSDDILFDHKWANDDAIGVDHYDRRPNKSTAEKGIVMRWWMCSGWRGGVDEGESIGEQKEERSRRGKIYSKIFAVECLLCFCLL